jgi:hypothetical protein
LNQRPEPTTFLPDVPAVRTLIERAIEGLLLLLDDLDGDADLEPTLGAPETPLPECVGYLDSIIRRHLTSALGGRLWPRPGVRSGRRWPWR